MIKLEYHDNTFTILSMDFANENKFVFLFTCSFLYFM